MGVVYSCLKEFSTSSVRMEIFIILVTHHNFIMNHDNRDRPEIFQNSLIECMPKEAIWALDLSIKHSKD